MSSHPVGFTKGGVLIQPGLFMLKRFHLSHALQLVTTDHCQVAILL